MNWVEELYIKNYDLNEEVHFSTEPQTIYELKKAINNCGLFTEAPEGYAIYARLYEGADIMLGAAYFLWDDKKPELSACQVELIAYQDR